MPRTQRMIYQTPETRQQILEAAWNLFRTRGFFDTQMKDVAAATNMSRSSLYRYFLDKTELALTLMQSVLEKRLADDTWKSSAPDDAPVLVRIETYLRQLWLNPDAIDEWTFLAEFDAYFSRSRVPSNFRSTLQNRIQNFSHTPLMELVQEGQKIGTVRNDCNAHLLAVTLVNAVRGLQQRILLRGDLLVEARPGKSEQMSNVHLQLLIQGLRCP